MSLLGLLTRVWRRGANKFIGVIYKGMVKGCVTQRKLHHQKGNSNTGVDWWSRIIAAPCPSYRQLNWRISFPYDCLLFTVYSSSGEEACEFYNFSELCDSGKFPESHELPFLGILFSLLEVATQHTDLELTSKGQGPRPNLVNKVNFFS